MYYITGFFGECCAYLSMFEHNKHSNLGQIVRATSRKLSFTSDGPRVEPLILSYNIHIRPESTRFIGAQPVQRSHSSFSWQHSDQVRDSYGLLHNGYSRLSPGVGLKLPDHGAVHSRAPSDQVLNEWSYTSTPSSFFMLGAKFSTEATYSFNLIR